jgi:hypothetical protein
VDHTTSMDNMKSRKVLPGKNSNSNPSAIQLVTSCYINSVISARRFQQYMHTSVEPFVSCKI